MRRTQEGYSPFRDDKPKDTQNSPFQASSVLVVKANLNEAIRTSLEALNIVFFSFEAFVINSKNLCFICILAYNLRVLR